MPRKRTQEEFLIKANEVHGDRFDYSQCFYVNRNQKVLIRCIKHDTVFLQSPEVHLLGCVACIQCGGVQLNTEEFIRRATLVHADKYDYSKTNYISAKIKVDIICIKHGLFQQTPDTHIRGRGCNVCSGKKHKTTEEFIKAAIVVHGHKYDYSVVNYINSKTKINIVCRIHGEFLQKPSNHLFGQGCDECGHILIGQKRKRSIDEWIGICNIVHNNRYDYSQSNYIDCKIKVKVACPDHGIFDITPDNHMRGNSCPDCYKRSYVSKIEKEWLKSLNNPNIIEQHSILLPNYKTRSVIVDGFDPDSNTVYEFYGDFWHGNPKFYDSDKFNYINHKTFGELYQNTITRQAQLTASGYKVVVIWEHEYKVLCNKPATT
jgi:hypothetical protein